MYGKPRKMPFSKIKKVSQLLLRRIGRYQNTTALLPDASRIHSGSFTCDLFGTSERQLLHPRKKSLVFKAVPCLQIAEGIRGLLPGLRLIPVNPLFLLQFFLQLGAAQSVQDELVENSARHVLDKQIAESKILHGIITLLKPILPHLLTLLLALRILPSVCLPQRRIARHGLAHILFLWNGRALGDPLKRAEPLFQIGFG